MKLGPSRDNSNTSIWSVLKPSDSFRLSTMPVIFWLRPMMIKRKRKRVESQPSPCSAKIRPRQFVEVELEPTIHRTKMIGDRSLPEHFNSIYSCHFFVISSYMQSSDILVVYSYSSWKWKRTRFFLLASILGLRRFLICGSSLHLSREFHFPRLLRNTLPSFSAVML